MERAEVVRRAWAVLEPELAELGYELVEVEFGRHGSSDVLRLFIDRDGGITIDGCAEASRMVSAELDRADFIDSEYMLEVSSPGVARPLRKTDDFERFSGESVKVETETPLEGRRRFTGTLTGFTDGLVCLDCDGTEYRIHVENVKHANLDR